MEAPEKIYLVPFGKPIIEPLPQEGSLADTIWSSKPYGNSNAGNIEYTRTNAFIEKARKAFCKVCKMPNCNSKDCSYLKDFRNHIEGE